MAAEPAGTMLDAGPAARARTPFTARGTVTRMPPLSARPRLVPAAAAAGLLLALAFPGCASPGDWSENRLRDLSDVVDLRYGTGIGLGIGVQFGDIFRTGLGCSMEFHQRQWFGRKSVEVSDGLFASGVVITMDGDYWRRLGPGEWIKRGNGSTGAFSLLILDVSGGPDAAAAGDEAWFSQPAGDPPLLTSLRVGGAVFLPAVNGGLYLNFGELADFVAGLFGGDPMNDDGLPKFFTPSGAPSPTAAPPAAATPSGDGDPALLPAKDNAPAGH